jgi:hypothetical protein
MALYEGHKARGEPAREVFSSMAQFLAHEQDAIRQGIAEALVDILFKEDEKDILEYLLFLLKGTSQYVRGASQQKWAAHDVSDTLSRMSRYAREKADRAHKDGEEDDFADYDFISSLVQSYSDFWLFRGTFTADIKDLLRRGQQILENPILEGATLGDELYGLYNLLYDLLDEVQLANEDFVPLSVYSLAQGATDTAKKEALLGEIGGHEAANRIAAVLKHLVNQPLYPLVPFLRQLAKAEDELEDQVNNGNMSVSDEVALCSVIRRWQDVAKSDLEYRKAALSLNLVNEQVYMPEGGRQIVLRVAISNTSNVARIGEARNVKVAVERPLAVVLQESASNLIPVILPWETDVTYDLLVEFPYDLRPGRETIHLNVVFDDLTEKGRSLPVKEVGVELVEWEGDIAGVQNDDLALAEIESVTGGDAYLRQLIDQALADSHLELSPPFLEDIGKAVDKISESRQLHKRYWEDLLIEKKRVLFALEQLLASPGRTHVRLVELNKLLLDHFPEESVAWSMIIGDLVHGKWLKEKYGLYCFRGRLLRHWIAKHGPEIAIEIGWSSDR